MSVSAARNSKQPFFFVLQKLLIHTRWFSFYIYWFDLETNSIESKNVYTVHMHPSNQPSIIIHSEYYYLLNQKNTQTKKNQFNSEVVHFNWVFFCKKIILLNMFFKKKITIKCILNVFYIVEKKNEYYKLFVYQIFMQ